MTLYGRGTRNISYELFQNGCVLKDPLSAFVCFFQHDSGIILSEIWLGEVRKVLDRFQWFSGKETLVEKYWFPPKHGVGRLLSTCFDASDSKRSLATCEFVITFLFILCYIGWWHVCLRCAVIILAWCWFPPVPFPRAVKRRSKHMTLLIFRGVLLTLIGILFCAGHVEDGVIPLITGFKDIVITWIANITP